MRGVLRHRDFRLLLSGQTASTIGDRIVFVALALYVTDIGTPTDVGIVLAAHAVPLVGFLLIGGVWADRLPRHKLVVATDLIRFALHATLAALIFTGAVEIWHIVIIDAVTILFALGLPVWILFGAFVAGGVGLALFGIWWETALAERVPPHLLSRVSAYDWMGSLALLPLGYVLAGPLGEALGEVEVLVGGCALALLAFFLALLVHDVRALQRV